MKYISKFEKFNEEFLDKLKKVFARKDDELANTIYDTLLNIEKAGKFEPGDVRSRFRGLGGYTKFKKEQSDISYKITETGKLSGATVSIYLTDRNSGGNRLSLGKSELDCSGGIVRKILELLKRNSC